MIIPAVIVETIRSFSAPKRRPTRAPIELILK